MLRVILIVLFMVSVTKVKCDLDMQTITIDILNDQVVKILHDLELLQLIRVHKEKSEPPSTNIIEKYKGAMPIQPLAKIDGQLKN